MRKRTIDRRALTTSTDEVWEFHPLTPERWPDLFQLFQGHGNPGYCWCMSWRLSSTAYAALDSAGRRGELESIVHAGTPTGVIGYLNREPMGWCSIAPRETYERLERSRTLKRLDDQPVWSVSCAFSSIAACMAVACHCGCCRPPSLMRANKAPGSWRATLLRRNLGLMNR
jgi:hypothetical protein